MKQLNAHKCKKHINTQNEKNILKLKQNNIKKSFTSQGTVVLGVSFVILKVF